MRVQPIGLIAAERFETESDRAGLAQLQAAMTHGHATALASSDLTAHTIKLLTEIDDVTTLIPQLQAYAHDQRTVYHEKWLGDVWQRPFISTPEQYIAHGWDECIEILGRVQSAINNYDPERDPCDYTGEGWIAEEAFGTALVCFLGNWESPTKVLNRAAVTKGDSDSLACIAGAFVGAFYGQSAWPGEWYAQIEYAEQLEQVANGL